MYAIRNLCPRTDIDMGRHGFSIDLPSQWPEIVAASKLTQDHIEHKVHKLFGNEWLDACGFSGMYDPDAPPFDVREFLEHGDVNHERKLGPNAHRSHEARTSIRMSWGPWGLEHISVPGNACGLDIDDHSFGSLFDNGRQLQPHNIDSWNQKNLLMIVFASIAEDILILSGYRGIQREARVHIQSNQQQ